MAHIGKVGPVLDRRDLNFNVDNNGDGWFKRLILKWGDLGTGPGAVWSHSTWDCGPGEFFPIPAIIWESDHVLKFGIHWYSRCEVQITPSTSYRRRIQLWTEEFNKVLEVRYGLDGKNTPGYGLLDDGEVLEWDPGFFDHLPAGALTSNVRGKFWADPPPH